MAVVAPEEAALTVTGWVPVDETRRYWRHEARYGEAVFATGEVEQIERGHHKRLKPERAPACRCPHPYGVIAEGTCWACGRRVA